MGSFDVLPGRSGGGIIERAPLCCSFQAPTLRDGAALAAELRSIAAYVPTIRAARIPRALRCDWVVTITTPPIPVTLTVLRRWEQELLAIEQRRSGCRFLGWRTCEVPRPSLRSSNAQQERDAGASPQQSQRQLVVESLLRHPPTEDWDGAQRRGTLR